jgi:hypothetical protein
VKRLTDNLKMIGILVGLFLALSGGLYKVWSVESQVKENTYWIDEERYDRLEARIAYKEIDCDTDAKDCGKRDQDAIRRWKRQIKKLGKKLGYE